MVENNKTEEFLQKLAPCIERGEFEACAEEAARVAGEMGIGAEKLIILAVQMGQSEKYNYTYVLALTAARGLEGCDKADAYFNAGIAAQYLGKLKNSEENYKKAIKADPKFAAAYYNYAILLEKLTRKDEAGEYYKKAIKTNPKLAQAHYNYAVLLEEQKREYEAEEYYKKAIEANPKYVVAHSNYAIILEKQSRMDEAEEHHKKAIEVDPKNFVAHSNYAVFLQKLNRKSEAEVHFLKAIEINPKIAAAHSNYALLLEELNRRGEAEVHFLKAIELNPEFAEAHSNYANLLKESDRKDEAEEHYLKAIETNPKFAAAHYNYAILLQELNRGNDSEEHYKTAIEANPKYAEAHSNYANLLKDLGKKDEAKKHYLKAIETNPKLAEAHSNYANLLKDLGKKDEAEEHYLKAIDINPKFVEAHGSYGLFLIEYDKRKDSWKETEIASNLCKETGRITQSYLAKAWFYQRYSEKNFNRKKFRESADDADNAGEEYLKAAETTEGTLKDNLTLQGHILKAKSFVRKIPENSWYRRILHKLGKNPNISELIDNLKNAAEYYEKASLCPVGEKQDICNACHSAISVFSDVLSVITAFRSGENPPINKNAWLSSLKQPRQIYVTNKLNNGVALVDTLEQLINCADELSNQKASGLDVQEYLKKCYDNLIEVSKNLDGALKVITYHSVEVIKDYLKKQGIFVGEEPKKSFFSIWATEIRTAFITIIVTAILDKIFSLNLFSGLFNLIKSLISGLGNP